MFIKKHIEIKRASVTSTGHFEGLASTFNGQPDLVGDIILPGAFTEAIRKHESSGTMPAMLWNHDTNEVIGAWINLEEDSEGLIATGKLTLGTNRGKEAAALMADDAIKLSIGFSLASGGAEVRNGVRYIRKINRLAEISLVAMPANPNARILTRKESEHLLRKAFGVSRNGAKRIMASELGDLVRHGQVEEFASLVNSLKQLNHDIISTR